MPNLDVPNMPGNELDFMVSQISTGHDHNFVYTSQSSANEGKFLAIQYCTCSLSLFLSISFSPKCWRGPIHEADNAEALLNAWQL